MAQQGGSGESTVLPLRIGHHVSVIMFLAACSGRRLSDAASDLETNSRISCRFTVMVLFLIGRLPPPFAFAVAASPCAWHTPGGQEQQALLKGSDVCILLHVCPYLSCPIMSILSANLSINQYLDRIKSHPDLEIHKLMPSMYGKIRRPCFIVKHAPCGASSARMCTPGSQRCKVSLFRGCVLSVNKYCPRRI